MAPLQSTTGGGGGGLGTHTPLSKEPWQGYTLSGVQNLQTIQHAQTVPRCSVHVLVLCGRTAGRGRGKGTVRGAGAQAVKRSQVGGMGQWQYEGQRQRQGQAGRGTGKGRCRQQRQGQRHTEALAGAVASAVAVALALGLHWVAWVAVYPLRGRTVRCAKSRLFSTTGSHGSQGPGFCTLQPLLVHQGFLS